jgi:D-alanyl-D-alanine dipeptidase
MPSQRTASIAVASRVRPPSRRGAERARVARLLAVAALASLDTAVAGERAALIPPPTLVPLAGIAPDIVQDMRYATAHNFTGRPVPGYEAPVCWLRPAVAKALARVQADLAGHVPPLGLAVLDCYRPRRSVAAFMSWARGKDDGATRNFHPSLERGSLIPGGYIARASTHSRGIAVDLTLVARASSITGTSGAALRAPCTTGTATATDGGLDMGTTFDCFDARSHTASPAITPAQRDARQTLKRAMERHGFTNYAKEWWHFTYAAADDGRSFDTPVTAAPQP